MSSVVIAGDTSGSITLNAPAVAGTTTLTLPATSGTVMVNGAAFRANRATAQTLSNVTWTKIQFNIENFDTANCYDSSTNYRFTPNVAGYYWIQGQITIDGGVDETPIGIRVSFNGSEILANFFITSTGDYCSAVAEDLLYFNGTTDYVEIFGYQGTGVSKNLVAAGTLNTFSGFLARGA